MRFMLNRQSRFRHIALDQYGREIGHASRARELHGLPLPQGQQFLEVFVQPEFRRDGIGSALLAAVEKDARNNFANSLACSVAAEDKGALAFARRHGYTFDYQMLEGALALEEFDPTPWVGAVAKAETEGIRFTTLLQSQDQPDILKNLYELDRRLSHDVPQWSGIMPPFEQYCQSLRALDPEAVLIAWDGPAPVGYSMTTPEGYTDFLGVLAEHRGKGIALALKVLTIEWARRKGLKQLNTHNNADTEPIINLNRKLGYHMQPGTIYLVKESRTWAKMKASGITLLSLAAFVGIYAWWKGWWYGAGMGAIILIHELGHLIAARMRLIPVTPPFFIPFIGALIFWTRKPPSAFDEAILAAGGPVAGLLASGAAWAAGAALDLPELVNVAYLGFSLHVFNLMPVLPLDGARISGAITRWFWYLFAPVFLFFCIWQRHFVLLAAFWKTLLSTLAPADDEAYYRVPAGIRAWFAVTYAGLLGTSVLGVYATGAAGGGFRLPWLTFKDSLFSVEFSIWATGIISVIYLIWRFGRPIWGPWINPVPRGLPAQETDKER